MGSQLHEAPVRITWITITFSVSPRACMCCTFLNIHDSARFGTPGTTAKTFKARLRLLARRRQAVAAAWGASRTELGWLAID
eukprot:6390917-Pyramimonas_sp.AAC.2